MKQTSAPEWEAVEQRSCPCGRRAKGERYMSSNGTECRRRPLRPRAKWEFQREFFRHGEYRRVGGSFRVPERVVPNRRAGPGQSGGRLSVISTSPEW
jgi:hypothetical protein